MQVVAMNGTEEVFDVWSLCKSFRQILYKTKG